MTDITLTDEEMVDWANASLERNREMKARIAELEAEAVRQAVSREQRKHEYIDRIEKLEAENDRLRSKLEQINNHIDNRIRALNERLQARVEELEECIAEWEKDAALNGRW